MDQVAATALAEVTCLVYHEARNVSRTHGKLSTKAAQLAVGMKLNENKYSAWHDMGGVRALAKSTTAPAAVFQLFADKYGMTLVDLEELYKDAGWGRLPFGGQPWAAITREVRRLSEGHEESLVPQLLTTIKAMKHNSGTVADKISELNAKLPH